jgi:hypothetical protein
VVNWHRKGFKLYWKLISRCGKQKGKKPLTKKIKKLIRRMANENPTWGAPRIHGELLKLGFDVCERSVSRYLAKIKPEPSGNKINKWMSFLDNQRKGIAAMDFFTVPTLFFKRLSAKRYYSHGLFYCPHFVFQTAVCFFHHRSS